jgi:hypothetical protein
MKINVAGLSRGLGIVAIVAALGVSAVPTFGAEPDDRERIRRAVSYLDGRQDAWSKFAGSQRGTGVDKTSCVSCHTGISYALARPALGRSMAEPGPSESQERMLAAVRLRVEHWAELDSRQFRLMYDSNARKKVESRGTESVLNALVLARDDAARGKMAPSAITETAIRHLWETQVTEGPESGSWTWLNFGLEPWEADDSRAFGASLAAIAIGLAPGYLDRPLDERFSPGLSLLRHYLRRRFPEETLYNRLWISEAATYHPGLLSQDQKDDAIKQLLEVRRDDGGWSLAALGDFERVDGTDQSYDADAYATALALRTLLKAGLPLDRSELAQALGWIRSHQREDGSFPGRSVNKERDPKTFVGKLMTDAATALAAQTLVEVNTR